jgi:hypothetical protein
MHAFSMIELNVSDSPPREPTLFVARSGGTQVYGVFLSSFVSAPRANPSISMKSTMASSLDFSLGDFRICTSLLAAKFLMQNCASKILGAGRNLREGMAFHCQNQFHFRSVICQNFFRDFF